MTTRIFRNAGSIVYGWGSLEYLNRTSCQSALVLVGQKSMQECGVLTQAVSYLEGAGAKVEVVSGVKPDPLIEDIDIFLESTRTIQPDLFVALGGGSVIDTAKALWASYEHPELDIGEIFKAYVTQPHPLPKVGHKARLVAIPSTSGTGSETSGVSILVETHTRTKRVLLSAEVTPDIAIIDPEIASHMPATIAAHSGLDALTHAIESYVSPWSTDFSEPLALKAQKLIFQNLREACAGSREAREKLHYASTLAGMAINNSITGLAHGMDKIGLHFNLSHGLTCGLLLPYTIKFAGREARSRFAGMARNLGLEGENDEHLARAFLDHLLELEQDIGIPKSFKELGIEETQYEEKVEAVLESAMKSGPTIFSPKVPSPDEMRQLYSHAYHGMLSF